MSIISEAFKRIEEELEDETDVIKIRVFVEPELSEDLPTGNVGDNYDDQTLDDWYDFLGTVEGIIENFGIIENIAQSNNTNSLSEYIDFYSYDKDGNKKDYIIDLRLSDHSQTNNARRTRIRNIRRLNTNYRLEGITINNKTYNSYHQAETAIRKMLADHLMND